VAAITAAISEAATGAADTTAPVVVFAADEAVVDSRAQRRLRRLAAEALDTLRQAMSTSVKPACTKLEATSASATRAAAAVERAAAVMARPRAELALLAHTMSLLSDRPEESLGKNAALWRDG